ncbi:MAG: crotonase/enoyl-CoA hydratase family protein [Pseudomonadota bacterium]|jgi:enoyl-CoA hydratase
MSELVKYERDGSISRIVFEDGKANVMSIAMLKALHEAFDQAEKDKTVVILAARGKHFSAGFDLNVFTKGTPEENHILLRSGAELALRILSHQMPVVAACHGNAYPMGAFLMLASDHRIAAAGDYKIGLNEVTIGLTVPRFAVELARQRLTPAYFNRTVVTGEMFGPEEACAAGFFDRIVFAADLEREAEIAARALTRIDHKSHYASKLRARGPAIGIIRQVIDEDITMDYANKRVSEREPA